MLILDCSRCSSYLFIFLNQFACACRYRTVYSTLTIVPPLLSALHECESSSIKATPLALVGWCRAVPSIKWLWSSVGVLWDVGCNSLHRSWVIGVVSLRELEVASPWCTKFLESPLHIYAPSPLSPVLPPRSLITLCHLEGLVPVPSLLGVTDCVFLKHGC